MTILIEKREGKLGVKIEKDDYGLTLSTMRNGHHWSGAETNNLLLMMLRDTIDEYLKQPPTKGEDWF